MEKRLLSKKVRFADGAELALEGCFGGHEYFRDTLRDTLEFRMFASSMTLGEADALFTAENCASLTIVDTCEVTREVRKVVEVEKEYEVTNEDGSVTTETRVVKEFADVPETTIEDEEFVYEGYSERVNLAKREEKVLIDDTTTETAVLICCKMGQKAEVEELRELTDELLLEVLGV